MTVPNLFHDGAPAAEADLARVAFAGFAHFTAMQVRDHSVRGLDLHLARLRAASDKMFGIHLHNDTLIEHLRIAVAESASDASVTLFVASRPGEFESTTSELETFIRISAPAEPPAGPMSLDVVPHVRDLSAVKHVGEVGKTLYLRNARARGFDDALFIDAAGNVSEASIWNIVFWDGSRILWPQAAMLDGVTQQILRRQLARTGIPQHAMAIPVDQIPPTWSAAIMNSWTPGIPVSGIGGQALSDATSLRDLLHHAYAAETPADLRGPGLSR